MRIGVPKEIKTLEGRVALVPDACSALVAGGHEVFVQMGAGEASGYTDADFAAAGATVLPDAAAVYGAAELLLKVKEPQPAELPLLRPDHLLFCYLHLAAGRELAQSLCDIGLTAVAFETVQEPTGLPLLAPMSDIAGRLAVQIGAHLLHRPQGGRGLLLGGLPGAPRGRVVVLGAGHAGGNAATLAAAMGAEVLVFERSPARQKEMHALGGNVTVLYPFPLSIDRAVREADLLVGAVLVPGAAAPRLVSAEQVATMRPGSVIVDISVDQGGCVETTRPTSYADPTYVVAGVTHFGVTNMPGAVPRTASQALAAALIPYALRLATGDWRGHPALAAGINVDAGRLTHPALQDLLS
jgi:alanine dehydrogenase